MADNKFINSSAAFLGRGWGFPVTFKRGINGVSMLEGENDIQSSLEILLATALGERVMEPGYGCNLDKLIFEPLDTTFSTFITDQIRTSILFNEPRVTLNNVDYILDNLGGRIDISIDYTIVATNSRANLVFPFYLNEGTDIKK
jgi:phage baseplate assembly protein W